MKSSESFKPFTINTQPDANPSEVEKHPNIPNINGSGRQTPKNFDLPDITAHPAKETIDFSKANNPDDYTQKIQKRPKRPSFASKIVKSEIQDLGERAREAKKRYRRIGVKTFATMLAATTVFTTASAIKKDRDQVVAINAKEKTQAEDTVEKINVEDEKYSFNDETNEITIRQKEEKTTESDKEGSTKSIKKDKNELTPAVETTGENQEDKIEMDMNIELNLTDSMKKQLSEIKNIYNKHLETYERIAELVEADTGLKIPPEMICAIHYRESSCDFTTYLHNGEKLGNTTTLVPAGIFFTNFIPAAADAIKREIKQFNYNTNRFHLKNDLSTLSSIAMFTETFNGTGARDYHNSYSSYVYTGTNKYHGGMYTADSKWSDSATDKRPGTIPIFLYLHQPAEE